LNNSMDAYMVLSSCFNFSDCFL